MPSVSSQKGTSKKGKDARQSRSRNSTPSLAGASISASSEHGESSYLELPIHAFRKSVLVDLGELNISTIPNSRDLDLLLERLHRLVAIIDTREAICDRGMRKLSQARKDRIEEAELDRREQERLDLLRREAAEEQDMAMNKRSKKGKEERPLTHGAHELAPQDGSTAGSTRASTVRKPSKKPSNEVDSASSSLSPPAIFDTGDITERRNQAHIDDEDSEDVNERQPPPVPALTNHKLFGDDPSIFPDSTVYEIRKVEPGMSEKEIKEIYSVADYPHDDLHDLKPGTPPDNDFSSAKPPNQTQANTFSTYLEPYFRPITEEDLAFLRERGDRVTPFIIPRRGKKHYTEIWAEEDGAMSIDEPHQGREEYPQNQPRGSIEALDDATGESELLSIGPVTARVLSTLRPERRAPVPEEKPNGVTNGDFSTNGESHGELAEEKPDTPAPFPSATCLPESSTESWKKAGHPKLDYAQVDERIKQELRHIGFLPPDSEPDYDAHYDDEVAGRLRYLQAQLKEISIKNGARKARLQQLAQEQMAHQEYGTICEDLDNQVNQAYLKRTRTMGKSKKTKRPGGTGGGSHAISGSAAAVAKPGIGDVTKNLMDRKKRWENTVSVIFDDERAIAKVPRSKNPGSSIFKPEDMTGFIQKERESWDEEIEEE